MIILISNIVGNFRIKMECCIYYIIYKLTKNINQIIPIFYNFLARPAAEIDTASIFGRTTNIAGILCALILYN